MSSLRKFLVIYISIIVTILTILLLYSIRISAENTKKVTSSANKISEELEQIASLQQSLKQKLDEVKTLKAEVNNIKNQQVLGVEAQQATSSPELQPLGFITISDKKWQSVDIYTDKSTVKVTGKAEFGKAYQYLKKELNWYQMLIPKTENIGWVNSKFFQELSGKTP